MAQANAIHVALVKHRPQYQEQFDDNFAQLSEALRELDQKLSAAWKEKPTPPLLFSHPVYQYLQRRYQLNGKSVHWEPNEQPSDAQWRELRTLRQQHHANLMLWEAKPIAATRMRLESMGIHSVVFEVCADSPTAGDYLSVMNDNVHRLESALQESSAR